MKVEARVVFKFQAGSLSEAGSVLDDLLERAGERADVDVVQVVVTTPSAATPVSLPAVPRQASIRRAPRTRGQRRDRTSHRFWAESPP
jgi:hypothetical protein